MIYIDAPYNLGKDDFRYSDKRFHDPDADDSDAVYVTNEDGGRHTKWLNFMAPRVYMLWQLLHEERGVLFLSINDVELFRIGMLLNEILGEENWVGTVVWHGNTDNNPTRIAIEHEYILCYAKSKDRLAARWTSPATEIKTMMLDAFDRLKPRARRLPISGNTSRHFTDENRAALGDSTGTAGSTRTALYAARRNMDNPGKPGTVRRNPPRHEKAVRQAVLGMALPEPTMKELIAQDRIIFGKDRRKYRS